MKVRNLLIIIILIAGLAWPLTSASAQTSAPKMTVTAGQAGYFKYDEWLPLFIELENQGKDLDLEVRVNIIRADGPTNFIQPVSLPSGSHKQLTLYVLPNNWSHELEVQLVQGETVLSTQKVKVNPQPYFNFLVGLFVANRGAMSTIDLTSITDNNRQTTLVDLSPQLIPEKTWTMGTFNVLVFNDIDTSQLTPDQQKSLVNWVQNGGLLILGGGTGAPRTLSGLPAELQPIQLNGESKLAADDLKPLLEFTASEKTPAIFAQGTYIAANSQLKENSLILAGSKDMPLLVSQAFGKGQIIFSALDLSAQPFLFWDNAKDFWNALINSSHLIDTTNNYSDVSPETMRAMNMNYPLNLIPALELPSVKWLAILLGIYILLVGPVNYLVLKRKKALHLAWVTIPSITLLFSAAAFLAGNLMRDTTQVINQISIVELNQSDTANTETYWGVFTPNQIEYKLTAPQNTLVKPVSQNYSPFSGINQPTGNKETNFYQGNPPFVRMVNNNSWEMQIFFAKDTWLKFGAISSDLTVKDGTLVGEIQNQTTHSLQAVTVLIGNQVKQLGDLAPGEKVNIQMPINNTTPWEGGLSQLFNLNNPTGAPLPSELELKQSIINLALSPDMYQKFGGRPQNQNSLDNNLLIFGWSDEKPQENFSSSGNTVVKSKMLVYSRQPIRFPKTGLIEMPPGLIQGVISNDLANRKFCGSNSGTIGIMLDNEGAEVEYNLQPPQVLNYKEVQVRLNYPNANNIRIPAVEAYNWQKKEWAKITDNVSNITLSEPAPYINSAGLIRFKIGPVENFGDCVWVDLGFKAEKQNSQGGL